MSTGPESLFSAEWYLARALETDGNDCFPHALTDAIERYLLEWKASGETTRPAAVRDTTLEVWFRLPNAKDPTLWRLYSRKLRSEDGAALSRSNLLRAHPDAEWQIREATEIEEVLASG